MARRLENDASASKYRFPLSPGRFVRATPHRALSILACPFAFFGDKYARATSRIRARGRPRESDISQERKRKTLSATAVVFRVHVMPLKYDSLSIAVIDNRKCGAKETDRLYEYRDIASSRPDPTVFSQLAPPSLLLTLFNAY